MGRTCLSLTYRTDNPDHPHAGGENDARNSGVTTLNGPSPRGWGERGVILRAVGCERTIPTRVGRTTARAACLCASPDHPHAGGENRDEKRSGRRSCGPSPRGWGERPAKMPPGFTLRTIPTRVGRTVIVRGFRRALPDHPHAGGENWRRRATLTCPPGPSPRGWGERASLRHKPVLFRTIPTRVGRTESGMLALACRADHPHAGGENSTGAFSGAS